MCRQALISGSAFTTIGNAPTTFCGRAWRWDLRQTQDSAAAQDHQECLSSGQPHSEHWAVETFQNIPSMLPTQHVQMARLCRRTFWSMSFAQMCCPSTSCSSTGSRALGAQANQGGATHAGELVTKSSMRYVPATWSPTPGSSSVMVQHGHVSVEPAVMFLSGQDPQQPARLLSVRKQNVHVCVQS